MTAICPSYLDTFKVMAADVFYVPSGLGSSTDVIDKLCKFILSFDPRSEITGEFKSVTGLISTLGFVNTLSGGINGDYRTTAKKISKGILLGAQGIDLFKGLDQLKILSLGVVSHGLGRFSVFAKVISISPPLNVAKDILIFGSTVFSIWDLWNQSIEISNKNWTDITKYDSAVHKNRIAVIADVAKLAIVGISIASFAFGAAPASIIFATRYGILELGTLSSGFGFLTNTTALIKASHGAAAA